MSATRVTSEFMLDATIVNADISASAGIELSKLEKSVIPADGSVAFSGDQSFGGQKITNLGAPSAASDGANKSYVDTAIATDKKTWTSKLACDILIDSNIADLADVDEDNGGSNWDGATLSTTGMRVLLTGQSTGSQNGIYVTGASGSGTSGAGFTTLTRASDFDEDSEVTQNVFTSIAQGGTYANTGWMLSTDNTITVGTTALTFTQIWGPGAVSGGTGITVSGNTVSITAGGVDTTQLADGAVTTLKLGADAVDGTKIADDAVDSEHLAAGGIDSEHFAAGAVDSTALGSSAVTSDKIATDAVTIDKLGSLAAAHELFVHNGTDVKRCKRNFQVFNTDSFTGSNPNKTFQLSGTPMGAVLEMLAIGGVVMVPGASNDYTLSTDTITMQRNIGADQNCLAIFTEVVA